MGALFLFGQTNFRTGEANMYPKPVEGLSVSHITSIGCSETSIVISADDTLIAWGASPTFGELVSRRNDLQHHSQQNTKQKSITKLKRILFSLYDT